MRPDPFKRILGEIRKCMNEVLKFSGFLGFFRRVFVFQNFSEILGDVRTVTLFNFRARKPHTSTPMVFQNICEIDFHVCVSKSS